MMEFFVIPSSKQSDMLSDSDSFFICEKVRFAGYGIDYFLNFIDNY